MKPEVSVSEAVPGGRQTRKVLARYNLTLENVDCIQEPSGRVTHSSTLHPRTKENVD